MPGGVIEVRRRARAGWQGRLEVLSVARSVLVAWRRGRRSRTAVPESAPSPNPVTTAGRMPVLVVEAGGTPRCVACGLCAIACPTHCLAVWPGAHPEVASSRWPERFDLDLARCIDCGLCEEACPERAIAMVPVPERLRVAGTDRVLGRDALLVPIAVVERARDVRGGWATDRGERD